MKGNLPPASFPPNIFSVGPPNPHVSEDGGDENTEDDLRVVVVLLLGADVVVLLVKLF